MYVAGVVAVGRLIPSKAAQAQPSEASDVVFCGDYETGDLNQFAASQTDGGTVGPEIVAHPTRSPISRYACAYQLSGTQYRCESIPAFSGAPFATEGDDLYYGWSVLYPAEFPSGPWQICAQWHQPTGDGDSLFDGAPPPIACYLGGLGGDRDHWYLGNNGQSPAGGGWAIDLGEISRGVWYDVVVRQKFSAVASDCMVEVWVDRAKKGSLVPPTPLIYPTDPEVGLRGSYFKVGYYRDPSFAGDGVVYFDNVRIARSYLDAEPRGCI